MLMLVHHPVQSMQVTGERRVASATKPVVLRRPTAALPRLRKKCLWQTLPTFRGRLLELNQSTRIQPSDYSILSFRAEKKMTCERLTPRKP